MTFREQFVRASVPFTVVVAVVAVLATIVMSGEDERDMPFDDPDGNASIQQQAESDTDGNSAPGSENVANPEVAETLGERPLQGSVKDYGILGDMVPEGVYSQQHTEFASLAEEFAATLYSRDPQVPIEERTARLQSFSSPEFAADIAPWFNDPAADEELEQTGEIVVARARFEPEHVYLYTGSARARGVVNIYIIDQEGEETGFYVFGVEVHADEDGSSWKFDRVEYSELE